MFSWLKKQGEQVAKSDTLSDGVITPSTVVFEVLMDTGSEVIKKTIPIVGSGNPVASLKYLCDAFLTHKTGLKHGGYVEYESKCEKYMGGYVR